MTTRITAAQVAQRVDTLADSVNKLIEMMSRPKDVHVPPAELVIPGTTVAAPQPVTNSYQNRVMNPQPGRGWITFVKDSGVGTSIWGGLLFLASGEQVNIEVQRTALGYDGKIKRGKDYGWQLLGEFHLNPFGNTSLGQKVTIPAIGEIIMNPGKVRSNRNCIQMQIVGVKNDEAII